MASYDYDFGVIGGGSAGLTAAAGAARLGVKTLLVEREGRLGGDCLYYGCVPSKTLIATAKARRAMSRAAAYGLPEVALEPVDFRRVRERILSVIATIQKHDSPERFCGLGAKVEFGEARFADDHVVEIDGRRVSARRWLVATGSEAAVPDLPGLREAGFITNKEIFYLDDLPESLVVLGAGPIAVEMAQAFGRLGTRVTIIQRGDQILSKEDRDMADSVMDRLREEGMEVALGATVKRVEASAGIKTVVVEVDGEERRISGREILLALGRRANVAGLGLDQAGVEGDAKGVKADERLRTTRPHIFAAGDVTGAYQFTHAAAYEAGVVLANAVFRLPRKVDYALLPWCTFCDPELGSIGLNEKRAAERGIAVRTIVQEFRGNDRALAEGEAEGRLKMLLDGRDRVVGVQILGKGAGDLIGEWAAVLGGGVKLSTLAGSVHPYPTLAEINKQAAGTVVSEKLFSDLVRKGLGVVFGYKGRACEP